jgi:hypothetical protein
LVCGISWRQRVQITFSPVNKKTFTAGANLREEEIEEFLNHLYGVYDIKIIKTLIRRAILLIFNRFYIFAPLWQNRKIYLRMWFRMQKYGFIFPSSEIYDD